MTGKPASNRRRADERPAFTSAATEHPTWAGLRRADERLASTTGATERRTGGRHRRHDPRPDEAADSVRSRAGGGRAPVSTERVPGQEGRGHADADAVMRGLAARQHGLVARAQLLEAGVAAYVIDHRLAKGRIDVVRRGVYRVGPAPLPHEPEVAALLSCGPSAILSHRSAAALWQLLPAPPLGVAFDVSVRVGHRASSPGVHVHRVSCLPADEVTLVEGIPVTVPARTLLDLAGQCDPRELEQAVARAERLALLKRSELARLSARHPHRQGVPSVRALLAAGAEPAFTRSEAEGRFLALVRKAQLRAPATNVVVRGCEVDFLWRAERLVVEIDGFAFHSSPAAFERDRRRDAVLAAAGFRVLRVTWRQLSREPEALLARLVQALCADTHG